MSREGGKTAAGPMIGREGQSSPVVAGSQAPDAETSNGHNMVYEGGPVFVPDSGLNDTGHRVDFATGAHREIAPGKGRFDLVSPFAIRELAKLLEKGAAKYTKYNPDGSVKETGERNWEKGLPLHTFLDSASRHLGQLLEGDKTEDHATAAFWNMMAFIHTRHEINEGRLPESLDDTPHGRGIEQ